ncbi:MAG: peptidase M50 [Nitrospinaceae bacterium]|nr:MAG: peptidase M50 [Nitrospinaceae bacterium]
MPASSPNIKNWIIFSLLLAGTLVTTYLAGGFLFSIFLMLILGTHEFGHYWASRKNNVKATLPFFIPAPPVFIFGTFGAFIQIKELIPNRRVLMEIGAAGPIAGFIVAVPTLILGLFLSETTQVHTGQGLTFGSSILLTVLSKLILGVTPFSTEVNINLHPIAFAGWIGLFVTALNLLPIGQLDGGHILYSLFKEKYGIFSKGFFVLLFPLGYFWPGWFFWAVMIALMGFKPAPLVDESVLPDRRRRLLGFASIIIFLLTFIPVPFAVV